MLVGCLCLSVAIFVCGYVNPSLDHGTNYASCWFFSVDHSRGFLPLAQLFLIGLSHQNILWCLGLIIWGCVHALAICLSGICCLLDELFISYSIGQHSNQFLKLKGEMVGEIRYASPSSPPVPFILSPGICWCMICVKCVEQKQASAPWSCNNFC